jgi:hypothetical protein
MPSGHALASFALMESLPDGDLKRKTAAFRAFKNALRVLYKREPLVEIFRCHGDAVTRYDVALCALCATEPALKVRLDGQEAEARLLAAVEPQQPFTHTTALLEDLANAGEWDLLREHAERHLESAVPAVAEEVRHMLALALANSPEPGDKKAAIALYESLTRASSIRSTDRANLALLLLEGGNVENAKAAVLDGIATCPASAVGHLADVGHRIVGATGDKEFRRQLEAAIAERGKRE